jgi:hypothetical protein
VVNQHAAFDLSRSVGKGNIVLRAEDERFFNILIVHLGNWTVSMLALLVTGSS